MKKELIIALMGISPLFAMAQGALDAYQLSQTELRGTARYMSMAGAFGALGGDLTTLNQNPGGIGVYRYSDIGLTLDFNNTSSTSKGANVQSGAVNKFDFTCNNVGYVGAYKMNSDIMRTFNWGFSYNRAASFNRHYTGRVNNIQNSLTNYIANVTNDDGYYDGELAGSSSYNPYMSSNAPWLSILAYNSYLINPNSKGTDFKGLFAANTNGFSNFDVTEKGGINEYSINFGGNFVDKIFWGIGFGITDINYSVETTYGETLSNANIAQRNSTSSMVGDASYNITNYLESTGTGVNYKMGFIVKPVNELRFGFAFHSPTYYSMKDAAYAKTGYNYSSGIAGNRETDQGYVAETWYKLQTPWKFIASAAAIIGGKAILSFDYEYVGYQTMGISSTSGIEYFDVKQDIKDYYKPANIYRIGGEYRLTRNVSVRAGYSYQSSPVNDKAYNNQIDIGTAGTMPAYSFDKSIQYITGGVGYKYQGFYADLAYVHKTRKSEYHSFSSEANTALPPQATIEDNNNQIVASIGFRF